MQNSKTKVIKFKQSRLRNFIQKLRVAYNVLKAEKSIIIIGKEIEAFNHSHKTVASICGDIHKNFQIAEEQLQDDLLTQAINRLVYN